MIENIHVLKTQQGDISVKIIKMVDGRHMIEYGEGLGVDWVMEIVEKGNLVKKMKEIADKHGGYRMCLRSKK